jgi:hypothetical protein
MTGARGQAGARGQVAAAGVGGNHRQLGRSVQRSRITYTISHTRTV